MAFISRADLVEEIGYPDASAVLAILADTLRELTDRPFDEARLRALAERCAAAQVDARQVRKLVLRAIVGRRELVLDPSSISVEDLEVTFDSERARLEPAG